MVSTMGQFQLIVLAMMHLIVALLIFFRGGVPILAAIAVAVRSLVHKATAPCIQAPNPPLTPTIPKLRTIRMTDNSTPKHWLILKQQWVEKTTKLIIIRDRRHYQEETKNRD